MAKELTEKEIKQRASRFIGVPEELEFVGMEDEIEVIEVEE